ncbi:hypothetical protein GUJ93_ZPchr0004g40513 [Zizania palustris]|uniref:Uncharacterized protein n=1 Tax=Zizania palustris TaxID=103762 RepID=A0A8J5S581_ZIZPA|nr:hypothetical protein GUJ93_ZPchr0004g40513 [Zizania palustris]
MGRGNSKVGGERTNPEVALDLSNMLGQRIDGLTGTIPDKSGRPLALSSSGGGDLGGGEGGGKCSVGGNHINGVEGGGDRRGSGVDDHDGTRGQSTIGG